MKPFNDKLGFKNLFDEQKDLFNKRVFVPGCPGCYNARKVVTQIILNKDISIVPAIKIVVICELCQKIWNVKE